MKISTIIPLVLTLFCSGTVGLGADETPPVPNTRVARPTEESGLNPRTEDIRILQVSNLEDIRLSRGMLRFRDKNTGAKFLWLIQEGRGDGIAATFEQLRGADTVELSVNSQPSDPSGKSFLIVRMEIVYASLKDEKPHGGISDNAKPTELIIEVLKGGLILVEGKERTDEELRSALAPILKEFPRQKIRIKADAEVKYSELTRVIDLVQKSGGSNITFGS